MSKWIVPALVFGAVLLAAASATADPPRPPLRTCDAHVTTAKVNVFHINQRSSDCTTAVHVVTHFVHSDHCLDNIYCSFGHNDWSCKSASERNSGRIEHHTKCTKGSAEVHFSWHRI